MCLAWIKIRHHSWHSDQAEVLQSLPVLGQVVQIVNCIPVKYRNIFRRNFILVWILISFFSYPVTLFIEYLKIYEPHHRCHHWIALRTNGAIMLVFVRWVESYMRVESSISWAAKYRLHKEMQRKCYADDVISACNLRCVRWQAIEIDIEAGLACMFEIVTMNP